MALEATFRGLTFCLHQLHDALNELQVTLGDKPSDDESAMADGLETAVLDLMGILHEARKAALNAQRAVVHPTDLDRARRALTLCQEHFHHIEKQFAVELVSYEKLRELARLGRERRSWLPWANTAKLGIEQCRPPLEKISTALAACWLELAERLGMVSVSVRTIGQQIKMPAEASVLDAEPVT
ncbi:MAG: hypothetical protein ABR912_13515 [Terracidiphilus sp.]|jgi:hypothetical protein